MARHVYVEILCDICQAHDDAAVEATELPPVQIGDHSPRVLALCEPHLRSLYEPFYATLIELGVPADRLTAKSAPKAAKDAECELCGKELANRQSLSAHLRKQHGTNLTALKRERAAVATESGDVAEELPITLDSDATAETPSVEVCDQSGCDYTTPEGSPAPKRAIAVHKARVHGIRGAKHQKKNAA